MSFEVMKAKDYHPKHVKDWKHYRLEPKLDGVRVICLATRKRVKVFSRNGRELDMFSHINAEILMLVKSLCRDDWDFKKHGAMFDGEMCSPTFGEISGAIHRKNHTEEAAVYSVFFAMPQNYWECQGDVESQQMRRKALKDAAVSSAFEHVALLPSIRVASDEDVRREYALMLKRGFEGAMVKNMDEPWVAKRTRAWMKMKEEITEDLPIIGWKPGKGKYNGTLGALIVSRKGKEVRLSGMDDDTRHMLFQEQDRLMTGKMIVEVAFQHATKAGSVRHPRFVRLRPDKEKRR